MESRTVALQSERFRRGGSCPIMSTIDVAVFLLRVVVGLTMLAHGAQKLFGWFGGPGIARLQQGFARQGFKPALLWVGLVILGEVGGGLSLALGFLTPLGAAGVFGAMFMATVKTHWKNGFFVSKGGFEFTLLLMTVSTVLGLIGPGRYSLDALFSITLPEAPLFLALVAAALVVDVVGLMISRPVAPTAAAPAEARSDEASRVS